MARINHEQTVIVYFELNHAPIPHPGYARDDNVKHEQATSLLNRIFKDLE